MKPLLRVGPKGSGQFRPISWDGRARHRGRAVLEKARRHGSETVWPYFYAGTMGLVQRDGINRLRHAMKYSRYFSTICTLAWIPAGSPGSGPSAAPTCARSMSTRSCVVIWGGNPVNTQVNVMTHAMKAQEARRQARRRRSLRQREPRTRPTCHLRAPGTDGALACAVMHVLFAEGYADRTTCASTPTRQMSWKRMSQTRTPEWASAITGLPAEEIEAFARLYGRARPRSSAAITAFSRSATARQHACRDLPAGRHRRLAAQGRRRPLRPHRHLPDQRR
jgi:anaerobic selenocysteine-containing dehydrogenase